MAGGCTVSVVAGVLSEVRPRYWAQGWPFRAEPRAGVTPAACRLTFVTPCLRLFLYRWPYSCVGPTWGPVLGSSSACVLAIIASSPRILWRSLPHDAAFILAVLNAGSAASRRRCPRASPAIG